MRFRTPVGDDIHASQAGPPAGRNLPPGLAVVAACWSVQQLPELPGRGFAWGLLLLGVAGVVLGLRLRFLPLFAGAGVAAAGWALICAQAALADRLDPALEGLDLEVVGVVESMPQRDERSERFRFRIEKCSVAGEPCPAPLSVRLGWYDGPGQWGEVTVPSDAAQVRPDMAQVRPDMAQVKPDAAQARPDAARARPTGKPPGPRVRPGERWALTIRLKRPHALLNPWLFDSELRSLQEGIAASGSVRSSKRLARANERIDAFVPRPAILVERARDTIRGRMLAATTEVDPVSRGVLVALTVGDQAAIGAPWWERFNRTGIGHLMSISGLHITMLAALGGLLAGRLWRSRWLAVRMHPRAPPTRLPAPHARWIFGLLVGFGYAALAGWGIPAQRTCWMLAAAGLAMLCGRARSPVAVLSTAAAVVCVLDPWAPMAAGFWLSFAAVGSIIWYGSARGGGRAGVPDPAGVGEVDIRGVALRGASTSRRAAAAAETSAGEGSAAESAGARLARWRQRARQALREAWRSQIAATLVLLPLGVVFFSSVSLVSPIANAVAIPLVSGVITPLALGGAVLACVWLPLGYAPLALAGLLTEWLLAFIEWLDSGSAGAIAVAQPSVPVLLLAAVACALVLAPMPFPGRRLAGLGMLPLLLTAPQRPAEDEIRLTALDVGQGTAVLVETARGRLLYDTGPAFGPDSDAGARIVLPWLRARGIRHLQAMVVSHADLDHAGGALSILRGVDVGWVATSLDERHPVVAASPSHFACLRGERWQWGAVRFEWLHPGTEPITGARSTTNARSCVLRVAGAGGAALLAGDIETGQERRMLTLLGPERLRSDVLLAPHHGSRTSSSPEFLDAVRPSLAVFQIGYRNRYRHPNAQVLSRYLDRGIGVLRSDAHAAIEITLRPGQPPEVRRYRVDVRRYWRVSVDAPDA